MSQITVQEFNCIRRLMNSKAFKEGFIDVRKKLGFHYDRYMNDADNFAYELGRQFALNYIGPLKSGRSVCVAAEMVMNDLIRSGVIARGL